MIARRILLLGAGGFIGSHVLKTLRDAGHEVAAYDNFCSGHRDALKGAPIFEGDIRDTARLTEALRAFRAEVVMHFAAFIFVGESVADPARYYANNVVGSLSILDAMRAAGVRMLVFSSTAAVYGEPEFTPMTESHRLLPANPYGTTKLAAERAMADYGKAYGLSTVALRYFNAAGCDPGGELGERHDPETHLIPLILREALRLRAGGDPKATTLRVFGNDYATPDGTCIRDYIHVTDLAQAHQLAMDWLSDGGRPPFEAFNLGTGSGFSVAEVIGVCREVTGLPITWTIEPRRPGDPPTLVADATKARDVLGWQPRLGDLHTIVQTAWDWFRREPAGTANRR